MAYFIVIGTNNNVQCVVDEIKNSHLQHNVITSGCIINQNEGLYYHWDIYNSNGTKTADSGSISLSDAFSNQIAQFKALLPPDEKPYILIISTCFDEIECEYLKMVCSELGKIVGTTFGGIYADIVLLGYDINHSDDVTKRPHWRMLELIKGLKIPSAVSTKILYINNIDYTGAATNADKELLGRFLCHWSKMVSAGGINTINSACYSIGLSEYQYKLSDLDEFFNCSAEEIRLKRKIDANPSNDTQKLIDSNDFTKIDLDYHWLDGLNTIKGEWESYCTDKWDWDKSIDENPYSLTRQEYKLASYLYDYLKLYVETEKREIENLEKEKELKKAEAAETSGEDINRLEEEIKLHQRNIDKNTFIDAANFFAKGSTSHTESEVVENDVRKLIDYLRITEAKGVLEEAINRTSDALPTAYPAAVIKNVGHAKPIEREDSIAPTPPTIGTDEPEEHNGQEVPREEFPRKESFWKRFVSWVKSLFKKDTTISNTYTNDIELDNNAPGTETEGPTETPAVAVFDHKEAIEKCRYALDKIAENRIWWNRLCAMIDSSKAQISNYGHQMKEFSPKEHRKSRSLIDMDMVRTFRDSHAFYKERTEDFLSHYFAKDNIASPKELIKKLILKRLAGKYQTLQWDGNNPFAKDSLSAEDIGKYVNYNLIHSNVFVEYIGPSTANLATRILQLFYSNNKNITTDPAGFRESYSIKSNKIIPKCHFDFTNSLCVAQVLDIPDHIDSIKDFKPKREYQLSSLSDDITFKAVEIVGTAQTPYNKAKIIYNWLCQNIEYDTTRQIHDADKCLSMCRGVCQAYCELFCHFAEAVGLTAEIIIGKAKTPHGKIADEKHAWLFVYTDAYNGIFIDPTWGAGYINNDGVFKKNDDTSMWFNVPPYWMAFSHFPDEQYWMKLEIEITEEQFEHLPYLEPDKDKDGKDELFKHL